MPGIQHAIDTRVKIAELNARTWREVVDRWELDAAALRGGKFDLEEIWRLQRCFVKQNLLYGQHLQDIVTQAGHATGQPGVPEVKENQEGARQAAGSVGCAVPGLEGVGSPLKTLYASIHDSTSRMLDASKGSHQTTI